MFGTMSFTVDGCTYYLSSLVLKDVAGCNWVIITVEEKPMLHFHLAFLSYDALFRLQVTCIACSDFCTRKCRKQTPVSYNDVWAPVSVCHIEQIWYVISAGFYLNLSSLYNQLASVGFVYINVPSSRHSYVLPQLFLWVLYQWKLFKPSLKVYW